jgi:hypothetical protein
MFFVRWGARISANYNLGMDSRLLLGGRYITFWKKVNGAWKVALDASATDAPPVGDCCKVNLP